MCTRLHNVYVLHRGPHRRAAKVNEIILSNTSDDGRGTKTEPAVRHPASISISHTHTHHAHTRIHLRVIVIWLNCGKPKWKKKKYYRCVVVLEYWIEKNNACPPRVSQRLDATKAFRVPDSQRRGVYPPAHHGEPIYYYNSNVIHDARLFRIGRSGNNDDDNDYYYY